jgi:hypothetical protein
LGHEQKNHFICTGYYRHRAARGAAAVTALQVSLMAGHPAFRKIFNAKAQRGKGRKESSLI